jgi:mono/diheme cytochrome c family protein
MKATSPLLPACFAALTLASVYAAATFFLGAHSVQAAQAVQLAPPASPGAAAPPAAPKSYPVPANLKVLPKNLNGEQVHEIMEHWEGDLGAHCSTCHTADPNNIGPNGKPRLNFADDAKEEKATARKMFTMVEEINKSYVATIKNSGAPVTCGTCHRGHLGPEPFVAPPEAKKPAGAPALPVNPPK